VASQFYEIRCESCRTSFPPETKRCIHCGAPLGGRLAGLLRQRGAAGEEPAEIVFEEEAEEAPQSPGRSMLWVITAMIAVGISMLRSCMEQ